MRNQPFAYIKTEVEEVPPAPPTPAVFPNWEQDWNSSLSIDYLNAMDALSGSTAQQMQDMEWGLTASFVYNTSDNFEAHVVKDEYIVAANFTTNKVLKINTTTNSASMETLSVSPSSRMRGGFAPSGSDSIIFTNHNGEFLRYRPSDNFAELFTTSSNFTFGPAGGSVDFNWRYYNNLNQSFPSDTDFTIAVDGNTSASFGTIEFTGSFNCEVGVTNPSTGQPTGIAFNVAPDVVVLDSNNEFIRSGSIGQSFWSNAEVLPYYDTSTRTRAADESEYMYALTSVESSVPVYALYQDGVANNCSGPVVTSNKPRVTTIGPDGMVYTQAGSNGNKFVQLDWKTGNATEIEAAGDTISGGTDFKHRVVTATNGAMYVIPFVNGSNVYRISPPLTGSDADNIANMVQSLFVNKGR